MNYVRLGLAIGMQRRSQCVIELHFSLRRVEPEGFHLLWSKDGRTLRVLPYEESGLGTQSNKWPCAIPQGYNASFCLPFLPILVIYVSAIG